LRQIIRLLLRLLPRAGAAADDDDDDDMELDVLILCAGVCVT